MHLKTLAAAAALTLLALAAPAAHAATHHTAAPRGAASGVFQGTARTCSETNHGPYCLNLPYSNCTAGQAIEGYSYGSYSTENIDFWTGSNGRWMMTLHNCGGALCIAHDSSNRLVLSSGCSYTLNSDTFAAWQNVNNAGALQNYGTNLYVAIWDGNNIWASLHSLDPLSGATNIIYYAAA